MLVGLVEFLGEFVLQVLFEVAAEAISEAITADKERPWIASTVGLVFGGGAAGLISAALFPHRMISGRHIVHGLSLLLAPVAAGVAMQAIGNRLRASGRTPTVLATFRGGATFAFAMALIRRLIIARTV
jgi:hypothetical protein